MSDDALHVRLDGWEGPLDLLLQLARAQKVDLAQLSIVALVDQYCAFVTRARSLKLEVAADYLVMAAWLAYLKSGLLLPPDPAADPDPHELARALAWRLRRLDAMRDAGARLVAHDRLGRDVFPRGRPEGLRRVRQAVYEAGLQDLLVAYAAVRARANHVAWRPARRAVLTLDDALARLSAMLGVAVDWAAIERFLPGGIDEAARRSALASTFAAVLELAKQGRVELRQGAGGPVMIRAT